MGHKAGANFPGIEQGLALKIPNDHGIKGIAGRVTADDELLAFVNFVFDPSSAALSRLIKRILPLGDDTLKPA